MKNSITIPKQLKASIESLVTNIPFMTLESALFPFLFPQGKNAYDGKFSLHDYVIFPFYIVKTLFIIYL